MATNNVITVDKKEFQDAIDTFEDMVDKIDDERWVKNRQAYYARKHFVDAMRRGSPSVRLEKMISVTTARKWAPPFGVRVGVVKNDPEMFPDISAQALASILEHGTVERYRKLSAVGFVTGRVHLGRIKGQGWLRKAYDRNEESFVRDVSETLVDRIEEAV